MYKQAIRRCKLSGPTNLSEILSLVRTHLQYEVADESYKKYSVLVILIDGEITDYQKSVDELVLLSELPISVVFVGIGSQDFG